MFAILTKYTTDQDGTKIVVTNGAITISVPFPYEEPGREMSDEEAHRFGLAEFLEKSKWLNKRQRHTESWIGGWTETGYAFVCTV